MHNILNLLISQGNAPWSRLKARGKLSSDFKWISALAQLPAHHCVGHLAAQRQRPLVSGRDRVHFAGAYWRYGFHEDGVVSALQAIEELEQAGR